MVSGEELFRRYQEGDRGAFDDLVALYEHDFMFFLNGVVNDKHEATHLMIEAFAQLALKGGDFSGRSSLKTYLYTIGKNLAFRYVKARRKERHISIEEIAGGLHDVSGLFTIEKSENEKSEAERRIDEAVGRLENQIDAMSESLPPVTYFAIPSGHRVVSQGHVCRTVCRRAERVTITASRHYAISPQTAAYLNRLSDWLYVFGRKAVAALGVKQSLWTP